MCGITGFINRNHHQINDVQVIRQMLGKIAHRGPDDSGICGLSMDNSLQSVRDVKDFHEKVWALFGFNRLSIQDISQAGHQPMISQDNNVLLSFNGEIYNVNELRKELIRIGNYQFRGNSDTEVILYLYQEYGILEMAKKLNGMFAIVIYDKTVNSFYFLRDRFGIIPFHFSISADKILYGSEIKSIIECPDFKRELNKTALFASLTYGYSDMPIHKNIQNAVPGVILTWDANRDEFYRIRFFDINDYHQRSFSAKYDYLEEATGVFKSCVTRQLISDVNLGVQLSGGVDSTLVAHCVSDSFKQKNCTLYGFSLTNHDAPKYDEEKYIDYAAYFTGIQVNKIDLCFDRFIDGLEHSIYAFERPFYSLSPIGNYLFSKEAKKKVTVLLSGEGADELGGGYSEMFGKYKSYEAAFSNSKTSSTMPLEMDSVHGSMEFIAYFDKLRNVKQSTDLLFDADLTDFLAERKLYWDSLTGTPFDKLRKMHFKYRLISMLERQNKDCLANSVENRVPFLDNEFVEYMFSLPEEVLFHQKDMKNGLPIYEGKYLLKQMNATFYGDDFAFRKKTAIAAPLSMYLSNPKMSKYINEVILPTMSKRGLVNVVSFINRLKDLSKGENVVAVWKLITTELWLQFFIDGRTDFYKG